MRAASCALMVMARPRLGVGALLPERALATGRTELRDPRPILAAADDGGDAGRAGDLLVLQIDGEPVLGKPPLAGYRRLGLAPRGDPRRLQPILEGAGPVGVVAVDDSGPRLLRDRHDVGDQLRGHAGVAGIARRHPRRGDELSLRVDGDGFGTFVTPR